eukprot:4021159-Prymnesium_polylepis.1
MAAVQVCADGAHPERQASATRVPRLRCAHALAAQGLHLYQGHLLPGGGRRRHAHVGRAALVRAAAYDGRRLPRDALLPRALREPAH